MEETEKYKNRIKGIIITISYTIIAIFILFIIGIKEANAESSWIEIRKGNDEYLCGSTEGWVECTYSYNDNGTIKYYTIPQYNIIIENLNLSAGKVYEIELEWYLGMTVNRLCNRDNYLTPCNYNKLTASITAKWWGVNGPAFNDTNKVWTLQGSNLVNKSDGNKYAEYTYTYKNVVEAPSNHNNRLYFSIKKRDQWASFGLPNNPDIYGNPTAPDILLADFEYTIKEIGDNGTANIIANSNKNTQDIINNANQNTDKVVDAITGPGLSEESKEPIDKEGINDYQNKEESLINKNELDKINDIDIVIDTNSNTFIWDLITRILNTNALIFGMVITILSIGLIKLLLNR